jgi:hypothetical protein
VSCACAQQTQEQGTGEIRRRTALNIYAERFISICIFSQYWRRPHQTTDFGKPNRNEFAFNSALDDDISIFEQTTPDGPFLFHTLLDFIADIDICASRSFRPACD